MSRPARQPRPSARLTGVVAAWLVIAGQLGGSLHHLAVEHTVCAAHGEIVHAGDAHHAADHAHDPITADAAFLPASADAHAAHDHCDALWRPGDLQHDPPRALALRVPPATGPPAAAPSPRAPSPARAVYRLAPKADPPARHA